MMSSSAARDVIQPARQRYLSLLFILQALLAVVVVAGTLSGLRDMREEVLKGHLRQASLQVRGFEDHVSQNLFLVDLMLTNLPELLADPRLGNAKNHGGLLQSIQRQMPALRSLSIAGADGRILASSSAGNVGVQVDLSAYLPLVAPEGKGVTRFGVPREGRDFFSSRVTSPAKPVGARASYFLPAVRHLPGSSGLMAIAAINPDYFLNHIGRHIDSGLRHFMLFDYQGILTLSTLDGQHVGSRIDDEKLLNQARDLEIGEIPDDDVRGRPALTVYRALRSHPFLVVAHVDRETALVQWKQEAAARLLLVGFALVATLLITGLLTFRLRAHFVREAGLLEAQRLAASVFAHSHDGILVTDASKRILAANPSFTAITGYAEADILGETPRFLSSGRHSGDFFADMWQKIDSTGVWQGEVINRRKDGSELMEWLTISSIRDAAGSVSNYVGVFKDTTALRDRERTIRQLSMAVEQSPSSIVITTLEPTIVYVNSHFTTATGFLPEEVIGQNPRILQSKLTPNETFAALWASLAAGESWEGEFVNRRKDGSIYYEYATVAPIKDEFGEVTSYVAIKHDITEQKRLERELRQAREVAESANLAKSRFLATMSHEIRTPLNGVLGMAQLLLVPGLTESQCHEYARVILNSGQTLLTLLNDILDLSKIEAGKVELQIAVVHPEQLIRETAALFGEVSRSKGLCMEAIWQGSHDLRCRADPIRLRQMLSNLVSNAIKFTVEGFVRVEGREVETTEGEIVLEFSVTDSGIGIPEYKQSALFKAFSQVDSSSTREYGGSGLGLSIVRSLALLMCGEVGVRSEPDKGSRFWFRIRAQRVSDAEDSRHVARAPTGSAVSTQPPRFVLVVEDNATNRLVIEAMLTRQGMRFESVENGQEAVDRVTAGIRPDLVLMDCQMPVLDGYGATKQIRAWEQKNGMARLPIIALTASAYEEDRLACLAAGMDDFLTKPVNLKTLAATLDNWSKVAAG